LLRSLWLHGALHDGTIVAVARLREAIADDCRQASLIVARFEIPAACRPAVIDRRTMATTGAIALRRVDRKWIAQPARSAVADRSWFGRASAAEPAALFRLDSRSADVTGGALSESEDLSSPDEDGAIED
jgi:competence protein ComEC